MTWRSPLLFPEPQRPSPWQHHESRQPFASTHRRSQRLRPSPQLATAPKHSWKQPWRWFLSTSICAKKKMEGANHKDLLKARESKLYSNLCMYKHDGRGGESAMTEERWSFEMARGEAGNIGDELLHCLPGHCHGEAATWRPLCRLAATCWNAGARHDATWVDQLVRRCEVSRVRLNSVLGIFFVSYKVTVYVKFGSIMTLWANDRGEPAVSYKWTGWVWETTGKSWRLQEN